MVELKIVENMDSKEWDRRLVAMPFHSVFQLHPWGEFKRSLGWKPVYIFDETNQDTPRFMAQMLLKQYPFHITLGWILGGPTFRNDSPEEIVDFFSQLRGLLQKSFSRFIVRTNIHLPEKASLSYFLSKELFAPVVELNSPFSSLIAISNDEKKDFLNSMDSKHRYYVKKSLKEEIHWRFESASVLLDDFYKVYEQMNDLKGRREEACSYDYIKNLCSAFGETHLKFLVGYWNNMPVTGCLVLLSKNKAYYFLAATNAAGRKLSSAYAMVYHLYHFLQKSGIQFLDLGGMAPANPDAKGVDHFKRGFGGTTLQYLGEWEMASSNWIRIAFNLGLKLKEKFL